MNRRRHATSWLGWVAVLTANAVDGTSGAGDRRRGGKDADEDHVTEVEIETCWAGRSPADELARVKALARRRRVERRRARRRARGGPLARLLRRLGARRAAPPPTAPPETRKRSRPPRLAG